MKKRLLTILTFTLLIHGCIEPYQPPVLTNNPEYLVVDAFVDTKNGTAKVVLNRSIGLTSQSAADHEKNATVIIENDLGETFQLEETLDGVYEINEQLFSATREYRLDIQTRTQRQYRSSFVKPLSAPPIDTVAWVIENGVIKFNISAHNTADKSRYYRWKYFETYQYYAPHPSPYEILDGLVRPRTAEEQIYRCWRTDTLKNIVIASTNRLSENVIKDFNLTTIPGESLKLVVLYSLMVQQQSLSEEAYTYWLNIQKTNETLGGLFDPIPGSVVGNIACITNPDEPVIGYFDAGEIVEKRTFLHRRDIPDGYAFFKYPTCQVDTIYVEEINASPNRNLIREYERYGMGLPYVYCFTTSTPECTDCRIFSNGTNVKPSFWIE